MSALWHQYVRHPRNVYDAQLLTHIVFVVAGIASPLVRSRAHQTESWSHTLFRLTIMLAQWFGCLTALHITLKRDENFISFFFESDVSKVTSLIELILSMVAVSTVYLCCFGRRRHIGRLFALLYAIDGRLVALRWTAKFGEASTMSSMFRRTVLMSWCCLGGNVLLLSLYILGSYAMQWGFERMAHTYAWVSYFWPQMVLSMVVVHAMFTLWQLARRFGQLNQVCEFFVLEIPINWTIWSVRDNAK